MYKLLLTTALMVYLCPGVLAICEPDCTGKKPGDKVEDPKDCHSYYICMAGGLPTDSSISCDVNNIFNAESGSCVSGSVCEPSCALPECHMTCTDNVDIISDPFDCHVFKVCLAAGVVGDSVSCPSERPYFDGKYCVNDKDKCCPKLCTPYCFPDVIQAPDPIDCYSYYICEKEGIPDEHHHFTCGDNEVFDVSLGRCVTGTQCKPLCGAVTEPPLSTSTPSEGCKDSLTCSSDGFFPQCDTCEPGYFECSGAGEQGILNTCDTGYVFNTNPDLAFCVSLSNCPYYS